MNPLRSPLTLSLACLVAGAWSCTNVSRSSTKTLATANSVRTSSRVASAHTPHLPLTRVADVDLPGRPTRFDYQDVDGRRGRLFIAHMNDGTVLAIDLKSCKVLKELTGIPVARGVAVAEDVGLVFVTSSPNQVVVIDEDTLTEVRRHSSGKAPDGVAWDPTHKVVGVSDQGDGALSLIGNSGGGARQQIRLGSETGNVTFDPGRGWFWITVVGPKAPDKLIAVDPTTQQTTATIALPGCSGAHGLRLHPDGKSAFVACESNAVLARVDLDGAHAITTAPTGSDPDVLALDPGLGWLYVAAESGDLTVFDVGKPGVTLIGHDEPGRHSHSVAVDPDTHRVFFPLMAGAKGTPVLRIMKPTGA